jgi:hypothetical protein
LDSPEWKAFNKYAFEQGYRVKAEPKVSLQFTQSQPDAERKEN